MQHSKLFLIAGGSFVVGAIVGWAVTADRRDLEARDKQEVLDRTLARQDAEIRQLRSMMEIKPINDLREDMGLPPLEGEGHLISDARLTSISLVGDGEMATGYIESVDGVSVQHDELGAFTVEKIAESDPENSPEEDSSESSEIDDDEDVIPPGETEIETKRKLQDLISQYAADPEAGEYFTSPTRKIAKHAEEVPPFVISRDKYAWDDEEGDEYAKLMVTYYPRERLLLDEDEEPVDGKDVDVMVGWRNLAPSAPWGAESGDPNVLFIRNRRLCIDYEVVKNEEDDPPIHVRYGMSKDVFEANKRAGHINFEDED